MQKYEGDDCDHIRASNLRSGEKEFVLVVHDECSAVHANEDESAMWVEKGRLNSKAKGALLNISAFLSEERGLLRFTNEEYRQFKLNYPGSNLPQGAEIFMKCGAAHSTARTGKTVLGIAHDGYWKNAHVLEQIK